MKEKGLFSGSCETQIGISRECCFPLNNSLIGRVLITSSIIFETIVKRKIELTFQCLFIKKFELCYFTVFRTMREFDG